MTRFYPLLQLMGLLFLLFLVLSSSGCAALQMAVTDDLNTASIHLHKAVADGILGVKDPVVSCVDDVAKYLPLLPTVKIDPLRQITTGADVYIWGSAMSNFPAECKAILFDIRMKIDRDILKMGLGAFGL